MSAISPCINICQLDLVSGLCTGCARTSQEITIWSTLTQEERKLIMAELPDRRALIRTPHSRCSPPKSPKR